MDCTKFGRDIGQSSMLYIFVLDFRYIAAVRNDGDRKATWGQNGVKIVDFLILCKI